MKPPRRAVPRGVRPESVAWESWRGGVGDRRRRASAAGRHTIGLPTQRRPRSVAHARSRRRVHRRAPAQRPAPDRRRGPPRARRGRERLVQRRLQARGPGQDRLRAPVRARDVPGLGARREGRAHGARPGGRRHAQRHDVARPHELLRDAAVAPARARDLPRGRPDGLAARRAEPGEPRQPARGRQEREALELRQPPVRDVEREAARAPVSRGAPVPPPDDRVDGGPRRGLARRRQGVLPDLLRAEQRRALGGRRLRSRPGAGVGGAVLRPDPGQRRAAAAAGPVAARAHRRGASRDRRGPRPAAARLHRVPCPGLRGSPARRARHRLADPRRRQGEPPPQAARPRGAAGPGRRGVHAAVRRRRVDQRRLGDGAAGRRHRGRRGRLPRGAGAARDRSRRPRTSSSARRR